MVSISTLLGKRIKEIRAAKNITQAALASMIDIEPTNLSKIEKGVHFPKDETINKIITALNTDIKTLFCFDHIQTKEQLICRINEMLNKSDVNAVQFFYRVLSAYNETSQK